MVFSGLTFLYLFLPLFLGLYFLVPGIKGKNAVLIVASLLFYAWGEPVFVLLLIASALVNYGFGRALGRAHKKLLLVLALCVDLGALLFFKYADFFLQSLNGVLNISLPSLGMALPIGISFYTFQAISYLVDVYRGEVPAQRSFWKFLLYLSLFPQLIAGPIVRYSEIEPQLSRRESTPEGIFYGAMRFFIGLGKKVLLADYAGRAASLLLDGGLEGATVFGSWLGLLLFAFQIYFDFSGYSDMAVGLGRVFGFRYAENFDLPYTACSITDFWRRWHISLGRFFRDYVYIPMGGNRRHQLWNLLVVWALTGLWHGASWNFLLWGLYFCVLLYAEKKSAKILTQIPVWVRRIFTLFFVAVGWAIFYETDLQLLWKRLGILFGNAAFWNSGIEMTLLNQLPLLAVCVIGSTRLPRRLGLLVSGLCFTDSADGRHGREVIGLLLAFLFVLAILVLSTVSLVGASYTPFLYFRF